MYLLVLALRKTKGLVVGLSSISLCLPLISNLLHNKLPIVGYSQLEQNHQLEENWILQDASMVCVTEETLVMRHHRHTENYAEMAEKAQD